MIDVGLLQNLLINMLFVLNDFIGYYVFDEVFNCVWEEFKDVIRIVLKKNKIFIFCRYFIFFDNKVNRFFWEEINIIKINDD